MFEVLTYRNLRLCSFCCSIPSFNFCATARALARFERLMRLFALLSCSFRSGKILLMAASKFESRLSERRDGTCCRHEGHSCLPPRRHLWMQAPQNLCMHSMTVHVSCKIPRHMGHCLCLKYCKGHKIWFSRMSANLHAFYIQ